MLPRVILILKERLLLASSIHDGYAERTRSIVMSRTRSRAPSDRERLAVLRRFLLLTLMAGSAGMGLELLFIGHVEDQLQLVPIALLLAGLIALAWHGLRPSGASARGVRLLMALFVGSGVLGVGLHYRGNQEFEREMYPERGGMELVRETLTGATPVLAPGSMALLGLVGLAAVHGFPSGPLNGSGITGEDAS